MAGSCWTYLSYGIRGLLEDRCGLGRPVRVHVSIGLWSCLQGHQAILTGDELRDILLDLRQRRHHNLCSP